MERDDPEDAEQDPESDSDSDLSFRMAARAVALVLGTGIVATWGDSSEDDEDELEDDEADEAARRLRFLFRFREGTAFGGGMADRLRQRAGAFFVKFLCQASCTATIIHQDQSNSAHTSTQFKCYIIQTVCNCTTGVIWRNNTTITSSDRTRGYQKNERINKCHHSASNMAHACKPIIMRNERKRVGVRKGLFHM